MITLDTSAILVLRNTGDPDFERLYGPLQSSGRPWIVPAAILAEIGYMIETRFPPRALDDFVADIEAGHFHIDCGDSDIGRIRHLISRYADLPLGLADAAVVACAERSGGDVMTLDYRHFAAVAREGTIRLVPEGMSS